MPLKGVTETTRCKARSNATKERCGNPARLGYTVCRNHGAGGELHKARGESIVKERQQIKAISRFVVGISKDDPEANILVGFENEYRRCMGRIRWYDEQIELLDDEARLIWGQTKEEDKSAVEFSGVDKTYEARKHMWLTLQDEERKNLREMAKVWLQAGLDVKRLEIERSKVDAIDRALFRILERAGVDVYSDSVRKIVSSELRQLAAQ